MSKKYLIVRVTAKAEYACMALIRLAQLQCENRPVQIAEIAGAECIPVPMLTQVMHKLRAAGLVKSTRGSAGGYRLARPATEIPLGKVLQVMDGQNGVSRDLPGASAQVLALVWAKVRETERLILEGTSIADLAVRDQSLDWVLDWVI